MSDKLWINDRMYLVDDEVSTEVMRLTELSESQETKISALSSKLAEAEKEIKRLKKSLSDAQKGWAETLSKYAGKAARTNQ